MCIGHSDSWDILITIFHFIWHRDFTFVYILLGKILLEKQQVQLWKLFLLTVSEIFIFVVTKSKEVADPGTFSGSLLQFLFLKLNIQPLIYFPSLKIWTFYIKRIIPYVDWFLSLSIIFSKFVPVIACINASFFFTAE